jgi:hypothetical protein
MINPIKLRGVKMKKEYIKPFALGMAAGMVVLLIVVFSAGWVVTSGSAKAEARLAAGQAVLERLAPIAVAQFMQDPNKEERLKELKKLDSYGMNNRTDYVKKQGWATMPGEKEPDGRVAEEAADLLVKIKL